jgi:hypothetical protein
LPLSCMPDIRSGTLDEDLRCTVETTLSHHAAHNYSMSLYVT